MAVGERSDRANSGWLPVARLSPCSLTGTILSGVTSTEPASQTNVIRSVALCFALPCSALYCPVLPCSIPLGSTLFCIILRRPWKLTGEETRIRALFDATVIISVHRLKQMARGTRLICTATLVTWCGDAVQPNPRHDHD